MTEIRGNGIAPFSFLTPFPVVLAFFLILGTAPACQSHGLLQGEESEIKIFVWEDKDKEFELSVGEKFQVNLDENPTTGFEWEIHKPGKPCIVLLSKKYVPPPKDPQVLGRGGTRIFTFKSEKPGRTELELRYRRPWEDEDKFSKSFRLSLKIVDGVAS